MLRRFARLWILAMAAGASSMAADGVIVYEHEDFRGRYLVINQEIPRLRDTVIGNDKASSIRVPAGWRALLFEDENFRGRYIEIRGDIGRLEDTDIGNDRLSSIRVYRDNKPRPSELREPTTRAPSRRKPERPRRPPRRPAVDAPRDGVTLYSQSGYRGASETFLEDAPRMRGTFFGNDRAASVYAPPGWRVTLFEHDYYRGRSVQAIGGVANLDRTPLGVNEASSMRVEYVGFGDEHGVTVFRDKGFGGRNEVFTGSVPQLRGTIIGNDQISSLSVAPGYVAILYEHDNYRGRAIEARGDIENMRRTDLGNDAVSSIVVRRDDKHGRWRFANRAHAEPAAILFAEPGYHGRTMSVGADLPNLRYADIGNDSLCSVRVPRGYEVVLYEHADFRGRSVVLRRDTPDLAKTPLGNSAASSLEFRKIRR